MHPILKNPRWLGLYLAAWSVFGILLAIPIAGPGMRDWKTATVTLVPLAIVYAFLGLAAWYPCRANPVPESAFFRVATVHLAAAVLTTAVWLLLARGWVLILERFEIQRASTAFLEPHLPVLVAYGLLLYLLAAVIHYLLLAFQASSEAAQRALRLEVLAREAELEAFKTQIDPHFLFNCLNSIGSLCGSDPGAARSMVVRLGGFLRSSLELSATDRIPLSREIELATTFVDVERVRFGERLAFERAVEPECESIPVPALLLQPLLENALKHGIGQLVEGGVVRLEAELRDGRLLLAVDNPCDPDRSRGRTTRIGLANVRGRLDLLYDGRAGVEVLDRSDRFRVEISLPVGETANRKANRDGQP